MTDLHSLLAKLDALIRAGSVDKKERDIAFTFPEGFAPFRQEFSM